MNDEKRHKGLEIKIYISLIIPAGFWAVSILIAFPGERIVSAGLAVLGLLAFVVTLIVSVGSLFSASRLLKRHLLIWYGCLFALIVTEVFVNAYFTDPVKLSNNILALGVVVLLVLPVIWLWNVLRS